MSKPELTKTEADLFIKGLKAKCENVNIRLRKGEYQYELANSIASSQLALRFPNVKEIIETLYGEDKANDLQFVRKIQTILKKMEKSNVIIILLKKKPWELQRYGLSSFSFQDIDRNIVNFATEEQKEQANNLLSSRASQQKKGKISYIRLFALTIILGTSFTGILWSLFKPPINPAVFTIALAVSVMSSLVLGKMLSKI